MYWKPTPNDAVRQLVKAGALIAAAIDSLAAGIDRDETPPDALGAAWKEAEAALPEGAAEGAERGEG
jgi:hypothetical protein